MVKDDGWTAVTKDGSLSAHFEHSVAITDDGPVVLSQVMSVAMGLMRILRGISWYRERSMKVRASVKKVCDKCKVIRRTGVVRVICENQRHKQRQG